MKHRCPECRGTFRRYRVGPNTCPLCGIWICCEQHWPRGFEDVFEPRKYLRRQVKLFWRWLTKVPARG